MTEPWNRRPGADEHAPYYQKYVDRVPDGLLPELLERQLDETAALLEGVGEEEALRRYAPGKWSVKEVLGHIVDTERVMAYRALCIARGEEASLPGFDENRYVEHGGFDARPVAELLGDLRAVRADTLRLLRSFDPEAVGRSGTANGRTVSVRALGYIIAGHERHHAAILADRYGLAPRPEPA